MVSVSSFICSSDIHGSVKNGGWDLESKRRRQFWCCFLYSCVYPNGSIAVSFNQCFKNRIELPIRSIGPSIGDIFGSSLI